jgi:hypothetical protein
VNQIRPDTGCLSELRSLNGYTKKNPCLETGLYRSSRCEGLAPEKTGQDSDLADEVDRDNMVTIHNQSTDIFHQKNVGENRTGE